MPVLIFLIFSLHLEVPVWFATPPALHKCQNSQNVQKCSGRVRQVFSGLLEPENSMLHGAKSCFRLFPPVRNRVCTVRATSFWDSQPRDTKSLLALSLSTCGHFGCFDTCTKAGQRGCKAWARKCRFWANFWPLKRRLDQEEEKKERQNGSKF